MDERMRLGFAVRVVGRPGLQPMPRTGQPAELSRALIGLRDVLGYLQSQQIWFYRMADPLMQVRDPFVQISECQSLLALLAQDLAQQPALRLSLHLPAALPLAVPAPHAAAEALGQIEALSGLLDHLEAQRAKPPTVLVTHLNGREAHHLVAWRERYQALSPRARRRIVLEHQPSGPSLGQLWRLHEQSGVPIVFDTLHFQLHNPEQLPFATALGLSLATWPADQRAKIHLSSARSEAHLSQDAHGRPRIIAPQPGQHADFIARADALRLLEAARPLPAFDLMIEAKAGDLALLRLRHELQEFEPELAARLS